MEDNNYIPDTEVVEKPEFLLEEEWFDVDIAGDWLDVSEEYVRPDWTLAYDGVPFAPLGGIHALTGQPGHGKTMTFTQFMVAVLRGEFGRLTYLLGEKIPNPKVLYIDTEMEKGNTQLVALRVYSLMGWTYGMPREEFQVLHLRETEKAEDRWRKTLKAIYDVRPTVCFIDGLLDVVHDFNENEECQNIIYKCMKVASHYNMSLWCLVHENPGSTKMVGHMGSILERKVTDAFGTIKKKDDATGSVTFTLKQKKARGKDVPDCQFIVVDDIHKFGIPEQLGIQPEAEPEDDPLEWDYEQMREMMVFIITSASGITTRELLLKVRDFAGVGQTKASKMIWRAEDLHVITRDENKRYHLSDESALQTAF